MKLKCVAIDDEPLALSVIESFCSQQEDIFLLKSFTDTEEAKTFFEHHQVDLIFLDIQMPDIDGIEFCKKYAQDKMVIFTTAFSSYANEGFNVNAIDYLLKPFDFERFSIACKKAIRVYHSKIDSQQKESSHVVIKSEYKMINLAIDRIIYIESKDDYVKLFLTDGKFIMSKITTKNMLEKLPATIFVRIHRSCIVNIHFVSSISSASLMIERKEFPIGKKYKEDINRLMKSH